MSTFGKITAGTTTITSAADNGFLSNDTPLTSGWVQTLTTRISVTAGSTSARGILYSDSANTPGTLLAYTDEVTINNTAAQAITLPFSGTNQVRISAGTQYWLGVLVKNPGSGNSFVLNKDNNANQRYEKASTYANGPLQFYSAPASLSGKIDAFITYSEGGHYYADIIAAIVSFLQTSTKARNIYAYETTKPAGYPAIMVTSFGGDAQFLDTVRNRRRFQFTIRVYQERTEVGAAAAETTITALVDELIAIFEAAGSSSLSNTIVFTEPPSVRFGYLQDPDPDVRTAEITLVGIAAQ